MTTPNLDRLLSLLDSVRPSGSGYMARCPAHEDRNPSLKIDVGQNGGIVLKCFAECENDAILDALGLQWADLSAASTTIRVPDRGRQITDYQLRDPETRNVVAIHRRLDYGSGNKRMIWLQPDSKTESLLGRKVASLPLYLGEALVDHPEGPVILTEGEKTADALTEVGRLTVGTATGASSTPNADVLRILAGRTVLLWPDNDEAGRKHMARIASTLKSLGIEYRFIDWREAPPKGDAYDFIDSGGDLDVLIRTAVESLPASPERNSHGETEPTGVPLAEEWEPPIAFQSAPLPAFPVDALPPVVRAFVKALATFTQTPVDLAGMFALAVLATAVARKAIVALRDGWIEPLNLFVTVVLPSGNRKSAVVKTLLAPLKAWEEAQRLARRGSNAAAQSRRRVKEGLLKKAEREAVEGKDAAARDAAAALAERLSRDLAQEPEPVELQLIADDATPEAVKTLLTEQEGRLGILSAEGGIFELMAGRYSANGAPNLEVFLQGHAGEEIVVNRRGRREQIADPALTIGTAIQPDVLRTLADRPAFRGRGLVARFLYALPESYVGRRIIKPPTIPGDASDAYNTLITALLDLPLAPEPRQLVFDAHAARRFEDFQAAIEPQLGEFGPLGEMADWGSKLPGAVARIAGSLHLAAHAREPRPWEVPIDREMIEAAIAIGEYAIPHALAAANAMGLDSGDGDARYLLRWLLKEGRSIYAKQEIWQGTRGRFDQTKRLDQAIDRLAEHRYIRPLALPERSGPGRPPAPRYEMNPHLPPTIPTNPTIAADMLADERDDDSRDSRDCRSDTESAGEDDDWGRL